MLIHWIWFSLLPGLTPSQRGQLLASGLEGEELFCGKLEELIADPSPKLRQALDNRDLRPAEQLLAACDRSGVQLLSFDNPLYPQRLRGINDPPALLYYKGQLPEFDRLPAIGVVGTRKGSAYGLNTAHRLGYEIALCGGLVVSGMALGVDAIAMEGALQAGAPTVAVLGCGPEQAYPRTNQGLYARILQNGCVLSEYPPGTQPQKWNFPRRNRIISGLSCGVVVVEAPESSGSLITARQALEQGRDVFVVPGNVDMPSFAGNYRLLKDGAAPVSRGWDVVSEYQSWFPEHIQKREAPTPAPQLLQREKIRENDGINPPYLAEKQAAAQELAKKAIDKEAASSYIDLNTILPGLTAEEAAVALSLKGGERLVDDVIAQTGLSTGRMLSVLTLMELKGLVQRLPGKRICMKRPHEAD